MPEQDLATLGAALAITEHRAAMLDRMTQAIAVKHSLTIEREAASVRDFREMIAYLEAAGMPEDATLDVAARDGQLRLYAAWSTDPTAGGQRDA